MLKIKLQQNRTELHLTHSATGGQMKNYHWALWIFIFVHVAFSCAGHPDRQKIRLIQAGDSFPQIPLPVPEVREYHHYLGTSERSHFTLKEVEADLIIVEILSVHCPSCQRQIKAYNKLFRLIDADPQTSGRIKMVGIAAGNTQREVAQFNKLYDVRFPIIPDPQYHLYNAVGETRAPFTIYVRQRPQKQSGIVAKTHFGLNLQYKDVFQELKQILMMDVAAISKSVPENIATQTGVAPVLTQRELEAKITALFANFGNPVAPIKSIALNSSPNVYTGVVSQNGNRRRLFAEAVSRPPVCIDCHDIHFIYVFDAAGQVIGFEPIHLTKYGNELWDPDDIEKMRSRIIGHTLSESILFQPEVDAVSSATITSGVIFNSIDRGGRLLEELRTKGLM